MNTEIYLAPMSGVTDLSFRLISRKLGAKHCFFEMLDSKTALYGNKKNKRHLRTLKEDSPIAVQLVGSNPDIILDAAVKITSFVNMSFLDLNSACPAKKIIKRGAGASLLKDRERLGKIIKKLSSKLKIPITVKLRSGFDKNNIKECVKTALTCQSNGASIIFIHGRTALQGYSGDIDYESIKAVKLALKIPVFGSGNIFNPLMAKKMVDETGCDGILVARGAFGNPWIFKDIQNYLKTGKIAKNPSLSQKKKVLKEHLDLIEKYKDIKLSSKIGFMGKVTGWYFKRLYKIRKLREQIHKTKSYKELLNLIDKLET